ncbi:nicotinate-nucleotide adenylyltransferase [Allobacillus sp. GCM10007491]|uniref:Probable nicotinate-nucleotide adenylyltransferase n=2 Tax=Allobacillus saliphilus TaxID=2912308 RepID=A0A941CVA7_9BACI|nr:nicotinate-nucleotide adenylyltransferase [Allobacillus saliphilus]MBR7553355.1 nicotinate-nucleotide adenylyltransferase [Allobacillus saliphilus]
MKVGLFGGTFDPPHLGHYEIGKAVREKLELDEVWFIPTYEPPHKDNATASPNDRLRMLERLIAGEEGLYISTIEFNREGRSYTIDTVKALQKRHPEVQFYFIIGGDQIAYLPNWYKIEELKRLVQFVGVRRKGYSYDIPEQIQMVEIPDLPYSSTSIREGLKNNEPIEGLDEKVERYIRENHLYER